MKFPQNNRVLSYSIWPMIHLSYDSDTVPKEIIDYSIYLLYQVFVSHLRDAGTKTNLSITTVSTCEMLGGGSGVKNLSKKETK